MRALFKKRPKWAHCRTLSSPSFGETQLSLSKVVRWFAPSFLVLIAIVIQKAFPALSEGRAFLLLNPAIFFGALFGGLLPGFCATAFAVVCSWYWFIPFHNSFSLRSVSDVLALCVFASTGILANMLGSRIRSSHRKESESHRVAEAAKNKLAAANEVLARQAEIIASSDDAVVSKTLDGRITSWNNGAARIFGYSPSEMIGRPIDVIVPANRKDEEKTFLEKLSRGERIEHYDTVRVCKDGTRVEVSVTLSPIRDSDGNIIGASKIARDITGRKLAQLMLEKKSTELEILNQNLEGMVAERTRKLESEVERRTQAAEKLRIAQQAAHIGTFDLNLKTGVNTWTPELEAIYGLAPGSFPKTQPAWENLVHPDDRARAIGAVNLAFQSYEPEESEWRVIWPDGSVRWLTGRFQVFKDKRGKPAQLTGVNIDITDRKEAEIALRDLTENLERKVRERTLDLQERDERLNFTLRSAQAGAWDWNIETETLDWDAAMFSIFGVSRESFKASYPAFIELVHPEDREPVNKKVLEAVEKDQDFEGEYRVIWPDKSIHHILARGKSYRNKQGKPSYMLGICWDVTQRKQEELASENKIRGALAEKEVLLREIHHRVKNNLNIISSLLELQAMGIRDPQVRDSFIESQNRVMSMALIHEKLYQSKNLARLAFANYVNELVLCIYHSYGRDPQAIRPEINIGKAELDIDTAIPCSLIINELVSNSLKHGFPANKTGHVLVSLQALKEESNTYELEVSDDGVGFPAGFQLEGTRSLGLKLVHSLTKQLGGTLMANGSKEGADFKVRFAWKRKEVNAYAEANTRS
jgi:PAS domain S-box-containing protein